ncbi:MAG TPA: TraR/DksA C4-type zinc finger protein [Chitinophagaceae bacterium]|jgi:RNA polymerase-binding transcription factor DksA|nr:TraR/DksA C4-type zinc finger protein [Chitinophagaceae bacterium]
MASKKKPAPKKAAKPAPKAAKKPAAKKTIVKKATKPAAAPKKAAAKPAPKKAADKKPVVKAATPVKVAAQPAKPAVAEKPATPPPPVLKKPSANDPKSLVSIKPTVKPVVKKEPPKPSKVVIPKTTIKSSVKYEPEFTKSVLDANPMMEHTGPTMRYSDADLQEFREIIQKKLDAAKKELAYLQGLITRRDEGGDMDEARYMTMEDGSVSMEREQLSQMASRQITFIDHLEKAMMRIENKTYGICRVTGKLIDKARLRAVPHATLSIEAKQMMNK